MKLLIISGSPRENSHSRVLADVAIEYVKEKHKNIEVKVLDLHKTKIQRFEGFEESYDETTKNTVNMLRECDSFIISSPVYNASYGSAVKNLFEHSNYKSLKGKVASFILNAGGQISFENVHSHLNSLMNYFSIFLNPKAVYAHPEHFTDKMELKDDSIKERIEELVDSTIELTENLKKV